MDKQRVRYIGQDGKREKKQLIIDKTLGEMLKTRKTFTVDMVLEEASKPANPLHDLFEWNNDAAADKFRKMQAYAIILTEIDRRGRIGLATRRVEGE